MSDEPKCPECNGFRGLPRILHDQETPRECSHVFHTLPEVIPFPVMEKAQESTPIPAIAEADVPKTLVPNPVCPYCGADPCMLKGRTLKMGMWELLLVRCANDDCRKTISIFPISYDGPAAGPAGPPGRFLQ